MNTLASCNTQALECNQVPMAIAGINRRLEACKSEEEVDNLRDEVLATDLSDVSELTLSQYFIELGQVMLDIANKRLEF